MEEQIALACMTLLSKVAGFRPLSTLGTIQTKNTGCKIK